MRTPLAATLVALLLLPAADAHGDGISLHLTDAGCVVTGPPCIVAPDGAAVQAGQANEVMFTNELSEDVRLMVHLDADGEPGSLLGPMTLVAAGTSTEVTFDVPADATGVWYMTLDGDSNENARLFGALDAHAAGGAGEDSPGLGVVVLLGALAVGVVARRR